MNVTSLAVASIFVVKLLKGTITAPVMNIKKVFFNAFRSLHSRSLKKGTFLQTYQ